MASITPQSEPIPGYILSERIGAGGYGEVWKADAPGGLVKAIKFVYGYHNEQRATREMNALERIKRVRHPFLLSLERIEVVDGQLLIVTELAEQCLKDRFKECREQKFPGIPRDELLAYLADTADALDYMSSEYSLQHLDVKPENLLLLAGRIKVADFGLVKDVQQSAASMMGGLTPLYASPEVFRGAPCPYSDQYSLAVMYCEMLTGTLPFPGETAAELTLQHLNDAPNLEKLSESDRHIVARSLAKRPEDRFSSCREFVDALLKTKPDDDGLPATAAGTASEPSRPHSETLLSMPSIPQTAASHSHSSEVSLSLPDLAQPEPVDLPALPCEEAETAITPSLVIGIGGAAAHALNHLRRRLGDQFAGHSNIPSLGMLLLDTDTRSLMQATRGDDRAALDAAETIALTLRKPQEYRGRATHLLRWLSRRWLYNIPRSLKTEGLRPLGRLAFVDHAGQTLQRIKQAVQRVVDAEAVAESSQLAQREFTADSIRVYIVASISGGTGSGMSLDVAYGVQAQLAKMGLQKADVVGVMMHSTGRNPRYRDVAAVNAFSWLREFNHFNRLGGHYPGDKSCGMLPTELGQPAFDHTYLTHLGDGLDEHDFVDATELVANYLYCDMASAARPFLETCRGADAGEAPPMGNARLRSFGLKRIGGSETLEVETAARNICGATLRRWAGELPGGPTQPDIASWCNDQTFALPNLAQQAAAQLTEEMEGKPQEVFAQLSGTPQQILQATQNCLRRPDTSSQEGSPVFTVNEERVDDLVKPWSTTLGESLNAWILAQADHPSFRVPGAEKAVASFQILLAEMLQEAQDKESNVVEQQAEFEQQILDEDPNAGTDVDRMNAVKRYFQCRWEEAVWVTTGIFVRQIVAALKITEERLISLKREIKHLATEYFPEEQSGRKGRKSTPKGTTRSQLQQLVDKQHAQLADSVDTHLQQEYVSQHGGLLELLFQQASTRQAMISAMQDHARQQVLSLAGKLDLLPNLLGDQPADAEGDGPLTALFAKANPVPLEGGGHQRRLLMLPSSSDDQAIAELTKSVGDTACLVVGQENELTLVQEIAGLSVGHVAVNLIGSRQDLAAFATRVHSRCDITWSPMTGGAAAELAANP